MTPPYRSVTWSASRKRKYGSERLAHLVSACIFDNDNVALLKPQACLLGKEEVGTFDDVLEMRFAVGIHELRDIGDIDCFRSVKKNSGIRVAFARDRMDLGLPSTTRNEDVRLVAKVSDISEVGTVGYNLSS